MCEGIKAMALGEVANSWVLGLSQARERSFIAGRNVSVALHTILCSEFSQLTNNLTFINLLSLFVFFLYIKIYI